MVRQGQVMPAYYGETANSCALDKCMEKAKEMMKWDEKFPSRDMGNGKSEVSVWQWQCRAQVFPL